MEVVAIERQEEPAEIAPKFIDIRIPQWEYLLEFFEDWDIRKPKVDRSRLDYRNPNNVAGHAQRAFLIWVCIQEMKRTGSFGIDACCGQAISPWCLGIDYFFGESHPVYGGAYHPHLTYKCEKLPFNDNTIEWIVCNHGFEHLDNSLETMREWLRVIKPGGSIAMVIPDGGFGSPDDPSHKSNYSAKEFYDNILDPLKDEIDVLQFDTLQNFFSFNVWVKKRPAQG